MYDDNYSSIEYDLENNIITCYGDNDKPCFTHSLNDNVQTWIEYDYNDNILYSYDSEGNSYMNFYTYYGELLVNETFDKKLIKEIQTDEETKTINYRVDESERFKRHDGIVLTLKYKNNELISYKSSFYKWDKIYGKNEPEEIEELYCIGDPYVGSPISCIEVSELKKFRNSEHKKYKYLDLIHYHSKKYLLKESNNLCDVYTIEYFVYDKQGRKIWGLGGHLNKESGREEYDTIEYETDDFGDNYEEYRDDCKEYIVSKKHINCTRPYIKYVYNNEGVLYCVKEQCGFSYITKYYNRYGILTYDCGDGKEYDDDGYLLFERYEYTNDYSSEPDIFQKEYIYNDNKIIIFKRILDYKYNNIIETFKYNDNGKLIYYKNEDVSSYPSKVKIQIYEYDEKDRLIHEYLLLNDKIHYESFRKYNDYSNLVKITSYTLK